MAEDKVDKIRQPKRTTVEGKPKTQGYLYRFDKWGPEFWRVMHAVTFLYPDEPTEDDKTRVLTFFSLVPFLLPCSLCGLHFARAIQGERALNEGALASRDTLTRWLVDVHNDVNERIEKQAVQYERVKHYYTKDAECPLRQSEIPKDPTTPYRIGLVVVSVLLGLALIGGTVAFFRLAHASAVMLGRQRQRQT